MTAYDSRRNLPVNVGSLFGLLWLAVTFAIIIGPLITLAAKTSPSALIAAFSQAGAAAPVLISLGSAALALLAITIAGTAIAWRISRGKGAIPRIAELAVMAMLLMPPLVIGLLLIFMAGPLTPIGAALSKIHLSATNTFFALVIAEVYEAGPYYVLGAAAAFSSVDRALEEQATMLGDSAARRFRRIVLPLAGKGIATSLAMAWARAVGAFGAVIIVAYHPYGLPLQIWVSLNESGLPAALPYALALILVALPIPLIMFEVSRRARD